MCGIVGTIWADRARPGDRRRAGVMADAIFHRGPDGGAVFVSGPCALGHRRLKIIDLSQNGTQPMTSGDGRFTITYNGEIYNYAELREELEGRGVRFRSSSDTEVLLELFARDGLDCLGRLNGIFGFAIWDAREQRLWAVRDPIGVKPVYWAKDAQRFSFASEVKALLAGGWSARPDRERLGEYLRFGSVAGDRTLFEGVRKLRPGGWLRLDPDGTLEVGRYADLASQPRPEPIGAEAAAEKVLASLERSVRMQMVSDVPVGSMCSGGIDSSAVTALSSRHTPGIHTYCIRIPVAEYDESTYGRVMADFVGSTHHELDSLPEDVAGLLGTCVWLHDEPLAHANSIPIFQVSRLARRDVIVLLSGEGADEVFAGYARFRRQQSVLRLRRLAPRPLLKLGLALAPRLGRLGLMQALEAAQAEDPAGALTHVQTKADVATLERVAPDLPVELDSRREIGDACWRGAGGDSLTAALRMDQLTHLQTLLQRQDTMCMGTSIESRVPMLDVDLVALANALPGERKLGADQTKVVLRDAVEGLLPPQIQHRPKYPFGLPLGHWFGAEGAWAPEMNRLERGSLVRAGVVDPQVVGEVVGSARAGRVTHADLVWYLMNLEVWWQTFVDGSRIPDIGALPVPKPDDPDTAAHRSPMAAGDDGP
jgi:asparagine synthase (glutamine-hydrolysing)